MEYLLVACVADLDPARAAPDRQRYPFADHRHMPGAEDRPRGFFEAAKVGCHLLRVVIGAGPIGAGNQDQHHFASVLEFHLNIRAVSCRVKKIRAEKESEIADKPAQGEHPSRLKVDGQVVAKTLSEELACRRTPSGATCANWPRQGLLQRVHGGALPASPAMADFAGRLQVAPASKSAVGRAAAAMVRPGQIVFLDGGTTAVQLARHLSRDLEAKIVTHSPSVAVELVDHPGITIELIGGRLFKHSVVTVGAAAIEAIGASGRTSISWASRVCMPSTA